MSTTPSAPCVGRLEPLASLPGGLDASYGRSSTSGIFGIGIGALACAVLFLSSSADAPILSSSVGAPIIDAQWNREIRLATVYDNHGNKDRQDISDLTTANHKKYAKRWKLGHDVVTKSLVDGQCSNPMTRAVEDCAVYWNKIKYFMNWCEQPARKGTEEWAIYADDDAVYTNFEIDPDQAIDQLRGGKDTSFIIATEGPATPYPENEGGVARGSIKGAVNSGVMIVRKDARGCGVIERIWNKRNQKTPKENFDASCPTRGICKDQRHGDEQGAVDAVLGNDPTLIGRDVTRIAPRDTTSPTRDHIAFNTVHRGGCFQAFKEGKIGGPFDIMTADLKVNRNGIWQPGDWIGQTAGYPMYGRDLSSQQWGRCQADPSRPVEPIRIKKVESMIASADLSNPASPDSLQTSVPHAPRSLTIGAAYDNGGNPKRDVISALVNANHGEYAQLWGMRHIVSSKSLLQDACTDPFTGETVDCVPYWNKIQLLRDWLREPKQPGAEEWFIFVDDDMVVTNPGIDPSVAIDQLRKGDESVIIPRDVIDWQPWRFPQDANDARMAVNTGLIIVRKDEAAKNFIDRIWSHRHDAVNLKDPICPTLGRCQNQNSLHEQEAAAKVLKEDPSLLNRVVAVPLPRDVDAPSRVVANTFKRDGCFVRKQDKWGSNAFNYDGDKQSPWGAFRPGDWMAQTAGVPVWGKLIPRQSNEGACHDDPNVPETAVRQQYIEGLLAESGKLMPEQRH